MVSRLVVVPSDGLSSLSAERCKAEKRTIMVKKNNECKVTADGAARYDFPYLYRLRMVIRLNDEPIKVIPFKFDGGETA